MILRVAANNLAALWDQVEPLALTALRGTPTHNIEDVHAALLAGTSTLFVQWEDRVDAITIVNFAAFPRGIWVHLWLVAARDDAALDTDGFISTLDHFRQINKCRGFQTCGARDGWARRIGLRMDLALEGASMRSTVEI